MLTAEDVARYKARAERELGAECARWLASGARAVAVSESTEVMRASAGGS